MHKVMKQVLKSGWEHFYKEATLEEYAKKIEKSADDIKDLVGEFAAETGHKVVGYLIANEEFDKVSCDLRLVYAAMVLDTGEVGEVKFYDYFEETYLSGLIQEVADYRDQLNRILKGLRL